jgi:guanyl-specific ribonuclease Sa
MAKCRFILCALLLCVASVSFASAGCDQIPGLSGLISSGTITSVNDLPDEALDAIELIQNGGPFPYSQDGDIYYNREGLLPSQPDGYYHVYTVETPDVSGKGDRRIVTGKNGEYYYTEDHYGSFRTITGVSGTSSGSTTALPKTGAGEISVNALPKEARDTLQLIKKGGPFPYKQDNTVFSNREGLLPKQPSGYYHEYTVVTPGASNRGARRIVAGKTGEYYYTDDHYASFKRIVE